MEDVEQAIQQVQALYENIQKLEAEDIHLKWQLLLHTSSTDPRWKDAAWYALPSRHSPEKHQLQNSNISLSLQALATIVRLDPSKAYQFNLRKSNSKKEVTVLEAFKDHPVAFKAVAELLQNATQHGKASAELQGLLRKVCMCSLVSFAQHYGVFKGPGVRATV